MKYMVIVDEVSVVDKDKDPHIELGLGGDAVTNVAAVPIFKPIMVSDNGGFVYMDQEHIDVLIDYERKENLKSIINRMYGSISMAKFDTKSIPFIPYDSSTGSINPQAVCVLKCCDTCKHKDKLITQEPCFSCETNKGWYAKWEATDNG